MEKVTDPASQIEVSSDDLDTQEIELDDLPELDALA